MSILSDLAEAWPLALIACGAGFVATFGRDPKADEHDVSDYGEPAPVNDAPRSLRHFEALDQDDSMDVIWNELVEILPPAPDGTDPGRLIATDIEVEMRLLRQYGTTDPAGIADAILREIAAEQRTLVGAR